MKTKKKTPKYDWDSYFDGDLGDLRGIVLSMLGAGALITLMSIAAAGRGTIRLVACGILATMVIAALFWLFWPEKLETQ